MAVCPHFRVAELAHESILDGSAELCGHGLHAVADAQHRSAGAPGRFRGAGRLTFGHARRTAGEDDPRRREVANERIADVERLDLAVHVQLAHAPGDELSVLRAE